jgi:hypothetical protein
MEAERYPMADDQRDFEPAMDPAELYREDLYTDRRVGTIRVLTPVKTDGSTDPARRVSYLGQAQIMTNAGMLPISFEIDAVTLAEAVEKFAPAAKVALEETVRELQEIRRQAASQLVIPEPGTASAILGAGSGAPPRGKIHL